ncbi:MAG: hypothetical protein U0166_10135 [Acidobacteriota bacterium]
MSKAIKPLADRLAGRGAKKLVFMLSVDKYDLYEPLIMNNPYPKARLFEEMAGLDHPLRTPTPRKIWQPMMSAARRMSSTRTTRTGAGRPRAARGERRATD